MAESDKKEPITIKKYANRRLYNTSTSKYVTLDDLSQMVKAGDEFVVVDAKSGDDITRSVHRLSSRKRPRGKICFQCRSCAS